ncbi:MAG: FKBP-type peptidyl-prolyl cis-trans isomerase N-terminal domain-containing protein [Akkermansiaceae bacterium]
MKKQHISSMLAAFGMAAISGLIPANAQDAPAAPPAPTPAPPATPPAAPVPVPPAPAKPKLPELSDTEMKAISSYAIGLQSARNFIGSGLAGKDMNNDEFVKGFIAALEGKEPAYSEDQFRAAMQKLGDLVQAREAKKSEANLAAGKAFLEKNGKREGVTTTASGLQYEVIKKGGDKKYVAPVNGALDNGTKFLVHYRGTLIDGTEFDKSPEGEPFPMSLQVIPGFKEALTTMPVGAKWKLFLPSELAYGARAGPKIGANSALIFELELVSIQAAPAPVPAPPAPPVRPKASATTPPVQVPAPPKSK